MNHWMKTVIPALAGCFMALAASVAPAQTWPSKPVRIIVPFPAGGAGDIVPRIIGERLSEVWGQAIIVENKAGAEGAIGVNAVAKANPDGYTLGVATSGPVVIGKRLFPNLPYDPKTDLAPVVLTYQTPFVLIVPPTSPAKSLSDLLQLAKQNPGKLNIAIPNSGSVQHLLSEQMKSVTKIDITNIPYKGGSPAAIAVASGEVDMSWAALPNVMSLIKAGRIRALAVSSEQRDPLLKDVPTVGEQGWPMLVAINWNGLIAPAGTPEAVLEKLNKEINAIMAQPEVARQFSQMGVSALGGTRQQFSSLMSNEEQKWNKVITAADIKPL